MNEKEKFEKSFQRPKDFFFLTLEQRWEIDSKLGIIDWVGGDLTIEEMERYSRHYLTTKITE